MNEEIIATIDTEISRLQRVRSLLTIEVAVSVKRGPGRPKLAEFSKATKTVKKRVMSDEARARIADAQKKRWAAAKRTNG